MLKALRLLKGRLRNRDGLLRRGIASLAVRVGHLALNLAALVILARMLGTDGFGVFAFVFACITTLSIPAHLGLPNLVVRETAKAKSAGDWPLIKALWRWATGMAMINTLIVMVVVLAALIGLRNTLDEELERTFYLGLCLVPLIALGNLRGGALRGLGMTVTGQLPEFIIRPLLVTVFALVLFTTVVERTPSSAMAVYVCASLVAFVLGAWMLHRSRPPEFNQSAEKTRADQTWRNSIIAFALIGGLQHANNNIGTIVLGLTGQSDDAGLFRIASQGASLILLGVTGANMVVAPMIASLYQEGKHVELQRVLTLSARAILVFSLPITLIFIVFGRDLIGLVFGAEYLALYPSLVILSAGQFLASLAATIGVICTMTGSERELSRIILWTLALNVILTLALAPAFGHTGAALATALSLFGWKAVAVVHVRRKLGFDATALGWAGRPRAIGQ